MEERSEAAAAATKRRSHGPHGIGRRRRKVVTWPAILARKLRPFTLSVLGIILGGGAGTRLYPLTKKRAKPAVPLGANYRLIDIPVINCLNSNISKIYVLT